MCLIMLHKWVVLINSMMAILRGPALPNETLLSLRDTTGKLFRNITSFLVCLDFGIGVFSGPFQKFNEANKPFLTDDTFALMILFIENGQQ